MSNDKPTFYVTEPPDHPCWIPRFAEFTWWLSSDNRLFIVIKQHLKWGSNELEEIELLEQNKESTMRRPWPEIHNLFQKGHLRKTSKSV